MCRSKMNGTGFISRKFNSNFMNSRTVIAFFERTITVFNVSIARILLLAWLTLSSLPSTAHPQDPREKKIAPRKKICVMTVASLISTQKDTAKCDTISVEKFTYSPATGFLERYDYRVKLDGGTFTSRTEYEYWQANSWRVHEFENGVEVSTGEVNNDTAHIVSPRENGRTVLYDYKGDSLQESVVAGIDTVRRPWKYYFREWDAEWDYDHAGTFARRVITKSIESDSIRYIDAQGKCMMMVVHHFNAMFKPIKSEYFNYSIKTFGLLQMRYTSTMDMIFYLNRSKSGKCTYVVLRKYSESGLLLEEKFIPKAHSSSIVTKVYTYSSSI